MNHNRLYSLTLSIIILTAIILPRLTYLNRFVTADENRWQARVTGFTMKLSQGRIGELLQQPHPGITTQWFASPAIWAASWAGKKIPLILAQCILLLFAGYLMALLWGKKAGYIGTLLLAINPFLIAHTRVYAMDSLLAIFLLLSILSLLVWNKEKTTRYLVYAGATGAMAFLSKLPGLVIIPYSMLVIIYFLRHQPYKLQLRTTIIWLISFVIASSIILPSFLIRPLGVIGDMREFFGSGDYTSLHQYPWYYYMQTLLFLTTPLQFGALIIAMTKKQVLQQKKELASILIFALLFIAMMTFGAKKGDRYILPAFILFDAVAAYVISKSITVKKISWATVLVIAALALQLATLVRIHPYELAYVNPLTKHWIGNRQLGWGEGLDIAIYYLNSKPDVKDIQIAMYYASQFENRFLGKVTPLHNWESESNDYAILYRAMYGRGPDAWETDVLNNFKTKTPEKIIELNGIPYIWIYRLR